MTEIDPPESPIVVPTSREAIRLARLDMPEGGYKRSKRPYIIAALVVAAIVGFVVAVQVYVFNPTKVGPDYSAAQNALGDTHRVGDLSQELLTSPPATPCPGAPTATVTAPEAAEFVNTTAPALVNELNAQSYDTGVRGCFINADGVKIETQIFRLGSQGGSLTVLQREFDASIKGDDTSTPRGNVVITGRETRTGPLITYVYGYRGVLMVTIKATPVTAASIDPAAIGTFYDKQMDKLKADEAQ